MGIHLYMQWWHCKHLEEKKGQVLIQKFSSDDANCTSFFAMYVIK